MGTRITRWCRSHWTIYTLHAFMFSFTGCRWLIQFRISIYSYNDMWIWRYSYPNMGPNFTWICIWFGLKQAQMRDGDNKIIQIEAYLAGSIIHIHSWLLNGMRLKVQNFERWFSVIRALLTPKLVNLNLFSACYEFLLEWYPSVNL